MKPSITIHVETLWTNRAELALEAELDNPHSKTNQEVVSMMFEAARLMAEEARGENERALFSQESINRRYRELDEREHRLDERDKRVATREESAGRHEHRADKREAQADERDAQADEREVQSDTREREQMVRETRAAREPYAAPPLDSHRPCGRCAWQESNLRNVPARGGAAGQLNDKLPAWALVAADWNRRGCRR
jgi:hypothetical protein